MSFLDFVKDRGQMVKIIKTGLGKYSVLGFAEHVLFPSVPDNNAYILKAHSHSMSGGSI
jgi:hypothetical protein